MTISLFFVYADTPWRRHVLTAQRRLPDEYVLYGLRDFEARGYQVHHNLNGRSAGGLASRLSSGANHAWHGLGGYGGDWAAVAPHLSALNQSRLVFSTVDRVGIPLVLLKYLKLVLPPVLYTSIGLPERLAELRNQSMRSFYYRAFQCVDKILCYGFEEARRLRSWLKWDENRVTFVPFGVDTSYFRVMSDVRPVVDVLAIGADPNRDFRPLVELARKRSGIATRIITTVQHAQMLGNLPANCKVLTGVPFQDIRRHIAEADVMALPLKNSSYSGGTTTLLQGMAMGKAVVVTLTDAIREGYHLEDDVNCKLVRPGDTTAFHEAVCSLLGDPARARAIGERARHTVETHFRWEQYIDSVHSAVRDVLSGHSQ